MDHSTSYVVGQVVGRLVFFGGLVALAAWGWRLRRSSRHEREALLLRSGPEAGPLDPATLPKLRGDKRMATGVVLLLLAAAGQLSQAFGNTAAGRPAVDDVRIALPASLLGAARNDTLVEDRLRLLRMSLRTEPRQLEAGYFGTAYAGVLVVAARDEIPDPRALADDLPSRSLAKAERYVSSPTTVDAGPLGGFARCVTVTQPAPEGAAGYGCWFVSSTTVVLVMDTVAQNLDEAADRARQVRATVVRSVDNPLPSTSPSPSPSPTPRVTLRLPPSLLGATIQRKDLAKDRATFVRDTQGLLTQADLGLYVGRGRVLLVETGAGDLSLRSLFLSLFERQTAPALGTRLGARQAIAPGPLGGEGYCWHPRIDGSPAYLCLLVDDQAYVAVIDYESRRLAAAADVARRVRAAVERRG